MIDRNHPAVEAAVLEYLNAPPGTYIHDAMAAALTEALRVLTDPRVDAPHLRDTPVGRALRAEGWDRGVADNERVWEHAYAGHDVDPDDPLAECQICETTNPYRT